MSKMWTWPPFSTNLIGNFFEKVDQANLSTNFMICDEDLRFFVAASQSCSASSVEKRVEKVRPANVTVFVIFEDTHGSQSDCLKIVEI